MHRNDTSIVTRTPSGYRVTVLPHGTHCDYRRGLSIDTAVIDNGEREVLVQLTSDAREALERSA